MKENELENLLIVDGILSRGFGTIGKIVMQDRRLTPYSKAIYSYFTSFAGGGSTAFPSVEKILYDMNMSKKTYYKHFTPLIDYGYISVFKRKNKGKFDSNIYRINMNPQKVLKQNSNNNKDNTDGNNVPEDFYYDWMAE